jgi:hypothetical protein
LPSLRTGEKKGLSSRPIVATSVNIHRASRWHYKGRKSDEAIKYVPIGDKIELNLRADPEVIFDSP